MTLSGTRSDQIVLIIRAKVETRSLRSGMMVFECRNPKGEPCMNYRWGICFTGGDCRWRVKTQDDRLYREIAGKQV